MQTKTQDVKMRVGDPAVSKVVGVATYAEYDAVSEAVGALGEEKTLEMINAQVRTNEMNRVRGLARGGPGKKALETKALASITPEEWASIAGDASKIQALLDSKIEQLKEEALANAGVAGEDE